MDPSTIGLIVIGAIVGAVVVIGLILFGLFAPERIISPIASTSFGAFFYILYFFLPYSLFLFGIVADGITRQVQYFPAGIVGLLMVFINYLTSYLSGGNTIDTDFCGIPGLSKLGSDLVPQSILFVSTVLSYIAGYVTTMNPAPGSIANWPAWTSVFAVFLLQLGVLWRNDCIGGENRYGYIQAFAALAAGIAGGGGAGAGFASLGLTGTSVVPTTSGGGLGGIGPVAPKTPGVGTCSPPNDQDQFVCEAYKNGELITTTIAE